MKVNILGTDYAIAIKKYGDDDTFERDGIDGWCDSFGKEIVLCDLSTCKGWEHETEETCIVEQKRTLRHEIIHAFLFECGLRDNSLTAGPWAKNEEMVDWFALQGPKVYKAWQEVDAL